MSNASTGVGNHGGPTIINGVDVSKQIRASVTSEVSQLTSNGSSPPALAVILVGNRKDSQTYVSMKTKACREVGIKAQQFDLPEQTTTVSSIIIHIRYHTILYRLLVCIGWL